MQVAPATACAAAATNSLRVQEALMRGTGREETTWPSSLLPVAFWLDHADRQPDSRAALPRNHRPVALPTPPPLPRLGPEVTAQQEQEETECGDADDPKNWISYVEHGQNINCWQWASLPVRLEPSRCRRRTNSTYLCSSSQIHWPRHSVRMSLPRWPHNRQRGASGLIAAALRRAGLAGLDLLMRAQFESAQSPAKDNSSCR